MKITKNEKVRQNISRVVLASTILITPYAAMAQSVTGSASCSTTGQVTLCSLVTTAIEYFNQAIYLIIALAVLTFVWNIYKFFIVSDPENRGEASKYVMYSVIGLFVILSFWGLVNIVSNTLNLNTTPGAINVQALTGSGSTVGSAGSGSGGGSSIFTAQYNF